VHSGQGYSTTLRPFGPRPDWPPLGSRPENVVMASRATASPLDTLPTLRVGRWLFKALDVYNADRLTWMEKACGLGPLVRLLVGPVMLLVISDPDVARTILIGDAQRWRRTPATTIASRLAAGENLFTQGQRSWAKLQPALAPTFRKRSLEPRLAELDGLVAEEIAALSFDVPVDLDQAMGRIAMVVASRALFGQRLSRDRADELVSSQRVIVDWVGKRVGSLRSVVPWTIGTTATVMRRHRRVLNAYADEIVAMRRQEAQPKTDVLQGLLEARPGGRPLTERQLRSQVLGLFAAGNETTAATLIWAMAFGSAYPHEWAALRSDPAAVEPYIDETLRLRPQAWGIGRSSRQLSAHVQVGSGRYRIRPDHALIINIWGMNRDPNIWPNPEGFDPGRQRNLTRAQERVSLPFGLGPRGCIGQHLAIAEMLSVLPALARHGDIHIDGDPVPDPVFTLRARGGVVGRFSSPNRSVESQDSTGTRPTVRL